MQIHGWGQSIFLWNRILRSQERSSWPVQTEWDFSGILMGRYQTCIKVNTKGNQPWTFIGRTYAEAKAPVLWPSDGKSWLIEKPLILGKIESKKRRGGRDWDGYLASLTQWAQISKLWEIVEDRETWPAAVPGVTKNETRLSDWITAMGRYNFPVGDWSVCKGSGMGNNKAEF